MEKWLFLDDDADRHRVFKERAKGLAQVTHVSNPLQANDLMRKERFDAVFLDRDLSHTLTGEDVAIEMVKLPQDKRPKKVVVHSQNKLGGRNMVRTLRGAGFHVIRERWQF